MEEPSQTAAWQLECFYPRKERVGSGQKRQINILILLDFFLPRECGSGIVDLDGRWKLFYSGADPNMGVEILPKRVWEFSQALRCQSVCLIGFLWGHGTVC